MDTVESRRNGPQLSMRHDDDDDDDNMHSTQSILMVFSIHNTKITQLYPSLIQNTELS